MLDVKVKDANQIILDVFKSANRPDNMPRLLKHGTREDLGDVFRELGFTTGAEIGTRKGIFAESLCQRHPAMHLHCIDPWMEYNWVTQRRQEELYPHALKRLSSYNVTIIRKTSMDAVQDFSDETLDFVYIDGNHKFDFVMCDLIHWAKKVRQGGIVALHDYRPGEWAGVVQAINAYTSAHDVRPWYVTRETEPSAFWIKSGNH